MSLYLDIETDFHFRITVVGIYERSWGFVQLVNPNISRMKILRSLPKVKRLFTFNGHCFDLPHIKKQYEIDLRDRYESIDLRYVCKDVGWVGGQKAIEKKLRLRRKLPGLDGLDAIRLWDKFNYHKDGNALKTLLYYNREDIMNMVRIRAALRRRGILR